MRAHLTTLLLLPALALSAQSTELVTLRDANNTVVNSGTITVPGMPTDIALEVAIMAELNGTSARTINVLRRELNVVPGSHNYFIWNELMYAPQPSGGSPTFVSVMPLVMEPQETTELLAYYGPEGTSGTACFRYVWYDVDTPMDSAWVNICFDTGTGIGVAETATAGALLDAYPNPAPVGAAIWLAYTLPEADPARLVVRNAQGLRTVVLPLAGRSGRVALPTAMLAAGLWHISLVQLDRSVATRRLVLVH